MTTSRTAIQQKLSVFGLCATLGVLVGAKTAISELDAPATLERGKRDKAYVGFHAALALR